MTKFRYRRLPDFSALLTGPTPPNNLAFLSNLLQINYFNTREAWSDALPHAHSETDECFLVLRGTIIIDIEGDRVTLGPREFCGIPRGTYHQVVEVHPPIECFVLKNSASSYDKMYLQPDGTSTTDRSYHQDIFSMLNESLDSQ